MQVCVLKLRPMCKIGRYIAYPTAWPERTLGGLINTGADPVCTRWEIPAPAVDVEQLSNTQSVNGDLVCMQSRQIIDNRRHI